MKDAKKSKAAKKPVANAEESETAAPPAASEPVLVTRRPIMKDPAATDKADEDTDQPDEAPRPVMTSSSNKPRLQPLADSVLDQDTEQPSETTDEADTSREPAGIPDDEEPAAATAAPETADTVAPRDETAGDTAAALPADSAARTEPGSKPQPGKPAEQAAPWEDAPPTPGDDKQKSPAAKQAEAEAAERAKHDEMVQAMIENKQYFLPINATEQRKNKKIVALGAALSVIMVLLWIDIALDAGIIELGGLRSITHFFSN